MNLAELAVHVPPKPTALRSSQMSLQKPINIIAMRIDDAKSMLAFPLAGFP